MTGTTTRTRTRTAVRASTQDAERGVDEDQLVRDHLPLVHYAVAEVAHRIPSHVNRNDLVSAGMLGLAQAARSFDPLRGSRSTASPPPGSGVPSSTSCAAATGRAARCGHGPGASASPPRT
ncbi:MAG: hypothetical protein M5U14_15675 [Acidimicrobiia bacterium]|nr:hypothetical protein [Acidimicrobiia bacterium]